MPTLYSYLKYIDCISGTRLAPGIIVVTKVNTLAGSCRNMQRNGLVRPLQRNRTNRVWRDIDRNTNTCMHTCIHTS